MSQHDEVNVKKSLKFTTAKLYNFFVEVASQFLDDSYSVTKSPRAIASFTQ